MRQTVFGRSRRRSWRAFSIRDGERIDRVVRAGGVPQCPRCCHLLEAQPGSRTAYAVLLDATAYDLTCRDCRRFWCVVVHTPRSLRLIRMRRFAAAVRAAGPVPATASAGLSLAPSRNAPAASRPVREPLPRPS